MTIQYKNNMTYCVAGIQAELGINMEKACQHLVNETKKTLTGQRSGRYYRVPGTKYKYYQASAPGEPPAVRMGLLRNSIKYIIQSFGRLIIQGVVGTPMDYAPPLEFGTSKMSQRAFLKPTFERERLTVKRILGGG